MKTPPIPTRFDEADILFVRRLARRTGLTSSEILRRAVRHLRRTVRNPGDDHILLKLSR